MTDIDEIIGKLKEVKWEEESRTSIETYRWTIRGFKLTPAGQIATPILKEILREQLVGSGGHAKDNLAVRLFNHYLDAHGKDFMLTIQDVKVMNSATMPIPGPIDIRRTAWSNPAINPEWRRTLASAKSARGTPQDYSGSLLWAWDNGAIANYTAKYVGKVAVSKTGVVMWKGVVQFLDRFDLDPRWGWSPANPGGRSRGGERRTRIGYILDLGTDFDIQGPMALATQRASVKHLQFSGGVLQSGAVVPGGDLFF